MNLYSSILKRLLIPVVLRRDNQFSSLRYLDFYMKSQYWSRQELMDYQWVQLKALISYAYLNCPYYTDLFNRYSLAPDSFKSFEDTKQIPILTRNDIFDHLENMVSTKFRSENLFKFYSGGTTGQQAVMYLDQESFNKKLAIAWRFENWMGKEIPDKMVYFWPASMDIVKNHSLKALVKQRYIMRQLVFYAGVSNNSYMQQFYKEFLKFKPKYIKAFPASLYLFSEYLEENNLKLPQVKGIMSTGEVLYPFQKSKFELIFQAPVFDMYGSREVGNTSSQCEHRNNLHIASETSYVEFINENQTVPQGEEGSLIITDLTNFGMPIIRYKINDYGISITDSCKCGRNLPLMDSTKGRLSDYFWGPDGTKYNGNVLGVHLTSADDNMEIGQLQFIQKSLTHFLVRITNKPEPTPEVFSYISKTMKTIINYDLDIKFEIVDIIPKEKSGKTRFVICEVEPPQEV